MSTESRGVPETVPPVHRPLFTLVVHVHTQVCVFLPLCANFRMRDLMRKQVKPAFWKDPSGLPPGIERTHALVRSFQEWRQFCQRFGGSDKCVWCVCVVIQRRDAGSTAHECARVSAKVIWLQDFLCDFLCDSMISRSNEEAVWHQHTHAWEGLLEGEADLTSLDSVGTVTCCQLSALYKHPRASPLSLESMKMTVDYIRSNTQLSALESGNRNQMVQHGRVTL